MRSNFPNSSVSGFATAASSFIIYYRFPFVRRTKSSQTFFRSVDRAPRNYAQLKYNGRREKWFKRMFSTRALAVYTYTQTYIIIYAPTYSIYVSRAGVCDYITTVLGIIPTASNSFRNNNYSFNEPGVFSRRVEALNINAHCEYTTIL